MKSNRSEYAVNEILAMQAKRRKINTPKPAPRENYFWTIAGAVSFVLLFIACFIPMFIDLFLSL